jgi:hypothetical protein
LRLNCAIPGLVYEERHNWSTPVTQRSCTGEATDLICLSLLTRWRVHLEYFEFILRAWFLISRNSILGPQQTPQHPAHQEYRRQIVHSNIDNVAVAFFYEMIQSFAVIGVNIDPGKPFRRCDGVTLHGLQGIKRTCYVHIFPSRDHRPVRPGNVLCIPSLSLQLYSEPKSQWLKSRRAQRQPRLRLTCTPELRRCSGILRTIIVILRSRAYSMRA